MALRPDPRAVQKIYPSVARRGLVAVLSGALSYGCSPPAEISKEERRARDLWESQTRALDQRDRGREDLALETLRQMTRESPGHPLAFELVVRLHAGPPPRFDSAEELMRRWDPDGPGLEYGLGRIAVYRRQLEAAVTHFRAALEQYSSAGDPSGQAFCWKEIGYGLTVLGKDQEAAEALRTAWHAFDDINDRVGVARVLRVEAQLLRNQGRFAEARGKISRARKILERSGDRRGVAFVDFTAGFVERRADRSEQALVAFESAASIFREIGDRRAEYQSVQQVARSYRELGRDHESLAARESLIRIALELGQSEWIITNRLAAGRLLAGLGDYRRAAEEFASARDEAVRNEDPDLIAASEEGLAEFHLSEGEYSAAAVAARRAVAAAREQARPEIERRALTALADAYAGGGRIAEAVAAQQEVLLLARKTGKWEIVSDGLVRLGASYRRLGNAEFARRCFEEALQIAEERVREQPDRTTALDAVATARGALGIALKDLGRLEEALEHQERALKYWESADDSVRTARARANLAELLGILGRHEHALELARAARAELADMRDAEWEADAWNIEARVLLELGEPDRAFEACRRAAQIARESRLRGKTRDAQVTLAELYERTGRPRDALAAYERAIEAIESQRAAALIDRFKTRLFASSAEIYERAVVLQAELEEDDLEARRRAFRLAERARSRSLVDLLAESSRALHASLEPGLVSEEARLLDRVSAAEVRSRRDPARREEALAELDRAERELERFKVELRRGAPAYAAVAYPDVSDLESVRRDVLADGEILVRYFLGGGRVLCWTVGPSGGGFRDLGSTDDIGPLVEALRSRVSTSSAGLLGRAENDPFADLLGKRLGLEDLPHAQRIVIVPDGPLHRVPFEVLGRGGRHLVEDYEVVTVPSATVLHRLRTGRRRYAPTGFLGVGRPAEPAGSGFPDLPETDRVLSFVADLFDPSRRLLLTGDRCTKSELRSRSLNAFRFIHFGTHGWPDPAGSGRVGLRMSPGGSDASEFLFPDDVYPLDLSAELVVLAACRSGLGDILPGEGVDGLTRAFLYAGARSVLVSLWNVSDRVTAEFMQEFYRALDGRTVPAALREAKLSFLRSERPARRLPYNWAPFVLVGGAGPREARITE